VIECNSWRDYSRQMLTVATFRELYFGEFPEVADYRADCPCHSCKLERKRINNVSSNNIRTRMEQNSKLVY